MGKAIYDGNLSGFDSETPKPNDYGVFFWPVPEFLSLFYTPLAHLCDFSVLDQF